MASSHTEHYGLNQWEGEDRFLRAEFNEDNRRVEEALTAKIEIKAGSYLGGTVPRDINVGFRPRAVLLERGDGYRGSGTPIGGIMLSEKAIMHNSFAAAEITENGFRVNLEGLCYPEKTYYYLAFQ